MRVMSAPEAAGPDPDPVRDEWQEEPGPGPDRWWESDTPELTYDQAAQAVPDDPDPARLPSGGAAVDVPKITMAVQRDIAGKTAFWLLAMSETWAMVDPYCGMAAADAVPGIARKAAPILCGSPDIVRWFTRASGFMQWTELLMACKPVFAAVVAHHVTKSVQTKKTDGQSVEKADWSAYTAA
jgi:hypothetical protein